MQASWQLLIATMVALGSSTPASATDLTLHLNGTQPLTRQTVRYQCQGQAVAMGLPAASFAVEYINGAGNSLAIVPIRGASMIFANITAGSGARYAAGPFIWWEAGGAVNVTSDSLAGKMQAECHRAGAH